jgi:hypothetical protein
LELKNTYRFITALALTAIFFTANFYDLFTIAGYYVNTSAYAMNCVNKNKPQMHCNGKCQLQKKLDTENKDQQTPDKKNDNSNEVLSSKTFFASVETPLVIINHTKYFIINNVHTIDKSFAFFHPPQNTI